MKPIDRVNEIIKYKNLPVSTFEKEVGLSNNAIQSAIKRNSNLKDETLINILNRFKEIDPIWLLLGEGYMLKSSTHSKTFTENSTTLADSNKNPKSTSKDMNVTLLEYPERESIAYYNEYASAGLMMGISEGKAIPDAYINVPGLNDCDLAINVYGESMTPIYQPGQIAICKKVPVDPQLSYVRFGEAYLAICDDGPVIKYIKKSEDKDYLVFASANEEYEPYLVHKSRIQDLYLIKGVVARKNL